MKTVLSRLPALIAGLVLILPLAGCGTYVVAKTVTGTVAGAGSLVVGGAVGAVKLTGKAAGAVTGIGRDDDDYE